MKSRQTGNGQDGNDDLEPMLSEEDEDFELESSNGDYLAMEQLIGTLIWSTTEAKLRLYGMSTTLDTTTLERRFSAMCVPSEWQSPFELRAEINFSWPAEYTSLSLYGDEALCALYHDDEEECIHNEEPADVFVELEIEYHLPYGFVHALNSDEGIERVARRIQQAFREVVDHENLVRVEVKATYSNNHLNLMSMKARHHWTLDEELHDLPLLSAVLLSISREVRQVLLRFAKEFSFPQGSAAK